MSHVLCLEVSEEEGIPDVIEDEDSGQLTISNDFFNVFDRSAAEIAKIHIRNFFSGKEMYCGGEIPIHCLLSPEKITMTLNTSVSEAVTQAHELLANHPHYANSVEDEDGEYPDVKLIASVIDDLRRKVPKPFQGGCLLMYLAYCKGVTPMQNPVSVSLAN